MEKEYTGSYIKIFVVGSEKYEHKPLYKAIVDKLDEIGISGATVIRGIEGFGDSKRVHDDLLEIMTTKLPVLIDVLVVGEEKKNLVLDNIKPMIKTGKISILENIRIIDIDNK